MDRRNNSQATTSDAGGQYEYQTNDSTTASVSPSPTEQSSSSLSSNQSQTSGSMESVADSSLTPSSAYSNGSSTYSSWPQTKGSVLGSEGATTTSNTTITLDRKPEGRLKIRTLCLVGALLPGIGCYLCIFYTYLFQFDRIMNFTSTSCDTVKR